MRAARRAALSILLAAAAVAGGAGSAVPPAYAAGDGARPDAEVPGRTGLPLPRFASLRADEVYLRTGPGVRYPVDWVYRRRGLPVMIVAEFDTWRKVRDWRGTVGWIHRSMLTGRRTAVVTSAEAPLLRAPETGAPPLARAEAGVVAELLNCGSAWCRIEAGGFSGWVPRRALWGTLPGETLD